MGDQPGGTDSSLVTDRELRRCTVKIDVNHAPKGTGFFVAPGHVVTCAHVLGSLTTSAPDALARLAVRDVDNRVYGVAAVADVWPEDDLAVIRVEPAYDHPCALLIFGLRMHDRLETFAYPELHREGVARSFRSEGTTGDERLHALAGGQVQSGMSGAPVLNKRTGGVCGVLRLTRDERQDLGGYAIPVEMLNLRSPNLVKMSERYHVDHREWFDLLPVEQKSALLDARGGVVRMGGPKCIFVVSVGKDGEDWKVSATLHPGGSVGPKDVDLNVVRDKVARLFREWASRGRGAPFRIVRGRVDPGEEVRLLGEILFSAVLPADIGAAFVDILPTQDEWVELALHFKPGAQRELVELPWEYLYLQSGLMTDIHIAADDRLAFVRVLSPQPRLSEQPRRRQLSALMIGVSPPDQLGASTVELMLERASVLGRELGIELETLEMPTRDELGQKAAQGAYDIVHYIGFGQYEAGADRLALAGKGKYEFEDAKRFAHRVAGRHPGVVVLQQVESAADGLITQPGSSVEDSPLVPADLSAFAWSLLTQGVEAVVAYQFPVSAPLSNLFNSVLYEQMAGGNSFERGAQKARTAMWMRSQEEHAFLSPALFVRQPGELKLTDAPPESTLLARVGVHAGHV
ncbi:MAG: CHAT domain-containing protein [Actinomycetota bacterium]|nr:CHAT domain-containing protein [Actinomycetota bacterium]